MELTGIEYLKEDFLDMMDIEARQGEPAYPFDKVMKAEFECRGMKYDLQG